MIKVCVIKWWLMWAGYDKTVINTVVSKCDTHNWEADEIVYGAVASSKTSFFCTITLPPLLTTNAIVMASLEKPMATCRELCPRSLITQYNMGPSSASPQNLRSLVHFSVKPLGRERTTGNGIMGWTGSKGLHMGYLAMTSPGSLSCCVMWCIHVSKHAYYAWSLRVSYSDYSMVWHTYCLVYMHSIILGGHRVD